MPSRAGCRRRSPRSTTTRPSRRRIRFHALIKQSLQSPGIRPQTPAYSDVSLAFQKALSPPSSIDPSTDESTLQNQIKNALFSGALL